MIKLTKLIRRPMVISLIIIVFVIVGLYFYFSRKPAPVYETAISRRDTISQEVSVTGKTKPAESVDLAFEASGRVKKIDTDVGKSVSTGQILVELDSSELYAQLAQMEASAEVQKAKLEELKKGATPEDIAVYQTKLDNAQVSLDNARANLIIKIKDAYTKSEDAIRAESDQLFINPASASPVLLFASSYKVDLENGRFLLESVLNSWQTSLANMGNPANPEPYLVSADNNLDRIKSFLEKAALAVNALTVSTSLTQTTIDTYTSAVSTARTNVNTAITNLQTAEETWRDGQSAILLAEKNLASEKAGATAEQILAQEAAVNEANANAEFYQVKIFKSALRSPMDGIVTKQDAKVGEIVSAGTPVVSIISVGQFEMEANIPEADIAKVEIGDTAKVTLDAFGSDVVFDAAVTKIDPAETVIEGVATYKTTFQFTKNDERVKSGMTANIDILTGMKNNVIVVPRRAVISESNGDKIIKLLKTDGTIEERRVETGLIGSDGNIEITGGLNEGEKIIVSSPAK